jgi:uncharacterized membrane protein YGL010W
MIRPQLLRWQWSDYPAKHRRRANLVIHIIAVPLFEAGSLLLIWSAVARSPGLALSGAGCMVAGLVLQGRGHKFEAETPTPFSGPADFVSRFLAEQWVTFPRFVLSGRFFRNLGESRRHRASS